MAGILSTYVYKTRNTLVKNYLSGDILEVGCNNAPLIQYLDSSQKYIGIDINNNIISKLIKQFPNHIFLVKDAEKDSFDLSEKVDTIILVALIEHLEDPNNLLSESLRYLKDSGKIIMTTPTKLGNVIHKIGAKLGLFSSIAAHDHKHLYELKEMTWLASRHGFKITKYKRFHFGFNQFFVLEKVLN